MFSFVRQSLFRNVRPVTMLFNNYLATGTANSAQGATSDARSDLWKLGKLNHVAIAVPNLESATNFYKNVLKAKSVSEPQALEEHGVYTVFVDLGNTKIELLYPLGEKSPIKNFLTKNKTGGVHHICIEVNNIEAAIKDIHDLKIRTLTETTRIGAHGKPVIFLHPKDCGGVLVEIEQA